MVPIYHDGPLGETGVSHLAPPKSERRHPGGVARALSFGAYSAVQLTFAGNPSAADISLPTRGAVEYYHQPIISSYIKTGESTLVAKITPHSPGRPPWSHRHFPPLQPLRLTKSMPPTPSVPSFLSGAGLIPEPKPSCSSD